MTTILTRANKGSAVTNTEFDTNLNNLNTYKIEDSDTRSSVRPTLIADFANTKKLPLNATFNRGSTGTYYDGKTSVKAEENLFQQSQDYTTWWYKARGTSTANAAVAPDGTSTANLLAASATGLYGCVYRPGMAYTSNTYYTLSVYAKSSVGQYLIILLNETGGIGRANFDLTNGVVGTVSNGATASMTSVGNGWYRCVVSSMLTATSTGILVFGVVDSNTTTNVTSGNSIYLWGAQLEQRSTVTSYTPTTSSAITNYIPVLQTAVINTPRFDVDPVTGESKGLLVESSATNLLTYSSQFDNAVWIKSEATILANATIAPDGTQSASLVSPTTSSAQHFVRQNSPSSGTTTFTVYAKSGGYIWLGMQGSGGSFTTFNLSTGVIGSLGTGVTASIVPTGNGWYRCSVTQTYVTQTNYIFVENSNAQATYAGDGYSGIYIWGAQLEAGSFATSYIPTTSSQVTRAADSLYTTDVSWLNPNEGTFLFNKKAMGTKANQTLFSLDNGTTDIESRVALIPNSRNLLTYTDQFDNAIWTKRGTATVTANATTAPDGSLTADLISVGAVSTNDIYQSGITVNTGNPLSPSVYILKVSTTGTVRISNPGTTNNGQWLIDLSLLGSTWTRIYQGHPAVTVSNAFTGTGGATNGLQFSAVSGTLSFYVWGAQLELGSTASPYEPNPLYLSTFEVGSDGYALSDNNTWNNLAAYAYASNDISASQNNNPYASVNIQSSTAGTKAIINKTSGTVDFKNCNIKDMSMGGGATFTASKTNNSYDQGNNFGITFQ